MAVDLSGYLGMSVAQVEALEEGSHQLGRLPLDTEVALLQVVPVLQAFKRINCYFSNGLKEWHKRCGLNQSRESFHVLM